MNTNTTPEASFWHRIVAAGRDLLSDHDLQVGVAQVVMAIAAVAVRVLTSIRRSPEPSA